MQFLKKRFPWFLAASVLLFAVYLTISPSLWVFTPGEMGEMPGDTSGAAPTDPMREQDGEQQLAKLAFWTALASFASSIVGLIARVLDLFAGR
jgi:hypothetical protein